MKKLAGISILCAIAFSAHAEGQMYMGLGLGYATQKSEVGDVMRTAKSHIDANRDFFPVAVNVSNSESQGKFGGKLYIGHQFNENFALELGYNYLNKYTTDLRASVPSKKIGSKVAFNTQSHIFSLTANGLLPLNDKFALLGKVGGAIYYTKAELSGASDQAGQSMQHFHLNDTKSTGTPVFGVGAEYKIDKDMTLRLEYENFSKPNVAFNTKMKRVDMISIGLRSSFN